MDDDMVVHPDYPGLTVEITVAGQPLPEYDDDIAEKCTDTVTNIVREYLWIIPRAPEPSSVSGPTQAIPTNQPPTPIKQERFVEEGALHIKCERNDNVTRESDGKKQKRETIVLDD
ncbi:hypothetical protein TW65_00716 [Stemphylium lycopersici]|nr:hypothetical protein TW65_00716 [Stemphylium lycopersici]